MYLQRLSFCLPFLSDSNICSAEDDHDSHSDRLVQHLLSREERRVAHTDQASEASIPRISPHWTWDTTCSWTHICNILTSNSRDGEDGQDCAAQLLWSASHGSHSLYNAQSLDLVISRVQKHIRTAPSRYPLPRMDRAPPLYSQELARIMIHEGHGGLRGESWGKSWETYRSPTTTRCRRL